MKAYFDNAATTYPKPDSVAESVYNFIKYNGSNIGRGAYKTAFNAAEKVYETRELICKLFNFDNPDNVVFTKNVTEALNIVIKGFLKKGDHVLVSAMEHNAVMRPLTQLTECGIEFSRIPSFSDGGMDIEAIEPLIKSNTRAIITTHASNVCGTIMPIEIIGGICRKHGLKFIVDAAQTAGAIPVDMKKYSIDALCFTGHKGLYGPQGIGGFVITDEMSELITPIISGGTGSISNLETIPDFCPDKFEAGTLNIPGIFGLNAGITFINEIGIDNVHKAEILLTEHFLKEIKGIYDLTVVGIESTEERTAVVSVTSSQKDISQIAYALDEYGVMTRVGMHCAPNAHKVLGTYPGGTLRFSFGYFNTNEEIDYTLEVLKSILI